MTTEGFNTIGSSLSFKKVQAMIITKGLSNQAKEEKQEPEVIKEINDENIK